MELVDIIALGAVILFLLVFGGLFLAVVYGEVEFNILGKDFGSCTDNMYIPYTDVSQCYDSAAPFSGPQYTSTTFMILLADGNQYACAPSSSEIVQGDEDKVCRPATFKSACRVITSDIDTLTKKLESKDCPHWVARPRQI